MSVGLRVHGWVPEQGGEARVLTSHMEWGVLIWLLAKLAALDMSTFRGLVGLKA